jgi:diguanylate cyclase (GGDEF)-like protein/PAS domain S-box-containing protein
VEFDAEARLRDAESYVRRVLDGALDAVIGVDTDGTILGWNAEASRLLGWSREDAVGRRLDDLALPRGQWPAFREAVGARTQLVLRDRDGAEVAVEASVNATHFDCGLVLTAFLRDVRPQRRAARLRNAEHRVTRLLAGTLAFEQPADTVMDIVSEALGWDRGVYVEAGVGTVPDLPDGMASCAAAAVTADGDEVGTALLYAREPGRTLPPDEQALLESIASALGQFEWRRALADETVALASVARTIGRVSETTDASAARAAICQAALEACGGGISYLAEPDEERAGLVVSAMAGAEPEPGVEAVLPFGSSAAAVRVYETGETLFLPDVAEDSSAARESAQRVGAVSGLLQPVVRDDLVVGVLAVIWRERVVAVQARMELMLRLLAGEAATALGRADLVSGLEAAARTDPLTGLPNLRAWDEQLGRELAADRRDGRPVCVALVDLDDFKGFNDAHGHLAGDRLLREAVAGWRHSLRAGDVLARLGGDEFAMLLPSCRLDGALVLADRVRCATPGGRTCSVGIAAWDGDEAPHELLHRADGALYAAKAAGRDRVMVS